MAWFHAFSPAVVGHHRGAPLAAGPVALIVAHQGGWDEMLMVAVPIAIFAVLLRSANKRAARLERERASGRIGDASPVVASPDRPAPRNERGGPI